MYAVVQTSGKQHFIQEGQELLVDRMGAEENSEVTLSQVLFIEKDGAHKVGTPVIAGALVLCKVVGHERGPKLINFKMRRRKNSKRRKGHRQELTRLLISKIQG